jgi:hypothetical protein
MCGPAGIATRRQTTDPTWLVAQAPATCNAAVIDKLLAAGATVIGKIICEEMLYSVTGINVQLGNPANLRAPGRMPGAVGDAIRWPPATRAGIRRRPTLQWLSAPNCRPPPIAERTLGWRTHAHNANTNNIG